MALDSRIDSKSSSFESLASIDLANEMALDSRRLARTLMVMKGRRYTSGSYSKEYLLNENYDNQRYASIMGDLPCLEKLRRRLATDQNQFVKNGHVELVELIVGLGVANSNVVHHHAVALFHQLIQHRWVLHRNCVEQLYELAPIEIQV